MAEAAALSLATDAATAVGQVLMGRTIEEMKMVWGLKDYLEKLKTKYSKLQRFLNKTGIAKHADKTSEVEEWVVEVKEAIYVADDIIDDYDYEVIRREREQKKQFVKQFRDFFSRNNNPIVFRIRMSHRVSAALAKFDELDKSAIDMGLKQVKITEDGIAGTSANNHQGEFVGREDEKKKLLQILCRQSNDQQAHISTVAILGIGGGSRSTSDTRAKTSNSTEPSKEARSISLGVRPEEIISNNVMLVWYEQLRELCGAVHQQCRMLDNWCEKTKQRDGWLPH